MTHGLVGAVLAETLGPRTLQAAILVAAIRAARAGEALMSNAAAPVVLIRVHAVLPHVARTLVRAVRGVAVVAVTTRRAGLIRVVETPAAIVHAGLTPEMETPAVTALVLEVRVAALLGPAPEAVTTTHAQKADHAPQVHGTVAGVATAAPTPAIGTQMVEAARTPVREAALEATPNAGRPAAMGVMVTPVVAVGNVARLGTVAVLTRAMADEALEEPSAAAENDEAAQAGTLVAADRRGTVAPVVAGQVVPADPVVVADPTIGVAHQAVGSETQYAVMTAATSAMTARAAVIGQRNALTSRRRKSRTTSTLASSTRKFVSDCAP